MRKEEIILSALTHDADFTKKAITHLQPEFFQDSKEKVVFGLIKDFYSKYSKLPTKDVLSIELDDRDDIPESEYDDVKTILKSTFTDTYEYDSQWLLDETEQFCKDRAVYNAIMQSVLIINGDDKKRQPGQIPKLLQDALAISFDHSIGHDYFADSQARYEFYSQKESKIACDIELLNRVTNGGVNRKTLNMFVAPPKAGKSLGLCSLAASYVRLGYNVLYVTEELAEFRVGERIDANLLNVDVNQVKNVDKDTFLSKLETIKEKTNGKLVIKEYPTKTASCTQFKTLIDDLILKQDFHPDVIIIDYLGITASSQYTNAGAVNSYTYQKAVSEEMRAMGADYNAAVWTAVQTNRGGMNASDFDVEDISDCLHPDTIVITETGKCRLSDLTIGQRVLSSDGWVTVITKHCPKVKKAYKIRTKSGKEIICSADHIFPTSDGRKNIAGGLSVGDRLKTSTW